MGTHELKDSDRRCSETRLSLGLEKSLLAYAVAAAGVSLLALTPCAEARIVYTRAHTNIPVDGGWVPVDLNHDGIADFSFSNAQAQISDGFLVFLIGRADNQKNAIWGRGGLSQKHAPYGGVFAAALHPGFTVGPKKSYFQEGTSRWLMALAGGSNFGTNTKGQWLYTCGRYLGLKFTIDGETHYGWARLTVTLPTGIGGTIKATLTGYAYETIPNKPIITGKTKGPDVITLEPATLGRLAQGASGISAWREKK